MLNQSEEAKAFYLMAFTSLFFSTLLFFSAVEAKDFLVGGSTNAWKIPSSSSESLIKWAETNRFQTGDLLVWKLDGSKDSVLQVTREDYLSCNTSSPVSVPETKDGTATARLDRHGAFYFISGAKGACEKGEKMIVVVIAPRRFSGATSPAPSPVEFETSAFPPVSGAGKVGGLGLALVVVMIMGFVF